MDDDGDDKDDTKRRTRNLSEKKRRDQFNLLVNELSSMISTNNRKMDKSTVLKSTISFLKSHNEITVRSRAHDVQEEWKPAFLSNEEFTYLVLEALEGFVMVFSARGQIYYVSESIASLLGHNPSDILNKTIFDLVSEADRLNLISLLQSSFAAVDPMRTLIKETEIKFHCHLRRGTFGFRDEVSYELIYFNGHFRSNIEQVDNNDNAGEYQQDYDSRLLFVCTGRLYTPQLISDVSLVDAARSEFTSRHSLEWKFLFLDHRAPPIIGYLPFEVLGTSGYDYYHFDDLEKVVTCHEALMRKGELTSCYYRFLTKGQQWIWLQTRFYITYHQWNSKPEFVVCTHRVVSHADIVKGSKSVEGEISEVDMSAPEPVASIGVIKKQPVEDSMVSMSPSHMSDASDAFATFYQPSSQPTPVKSASASRTTGTVATSPKTVTSCMSWSRSHVRCGLDTGSQIDNESRSQCNGSKDLIPSLASFVDDRELSGCAGINVMLYPQTNKAEALLVPGHGTAAQYLEPASYASAVSVPAVLPLPLPALPVVVPSGQAQLQVQLQRKHEQLQQMIVRQQEELRQVKEQLLLARLGILQPLINMQTPFMQQPRSTQTVYEANNTRVVASSTYSLPHPPCPTPRHPHLPQ